MIIFPKTTIIDIETTEHTLAMSRGRFPEVVEIGAIRCGPGLQVEDEYSQTIRPQHIDDYSEYCERFTGIPRREVEESPKFKDIWKDFAQFTNFNATLIMSWGAANDYPILRLEYARARTGWPHSQPMFDAISFCLANSLRQGFKVPRWSLKAACERFDIQPEKSHRAITGARGCLSVLKALCEEEGDQGSEDWMKVQIH